MHRSLFITGATGALGVPLLAEIIRTRAFDRIYALTRTDAAGLLLALRAELPDTDLSHVICLVGELGGPATPGLLAVLPRNIGCVIHAAALTRFRAPAAELARANVTATQQVLAWAATLPRAPRFLHFSTTCVAGERVGEIAEAPLPVATGFVNAYEHTKWSAEQLVAHSPLRPETVRCATVVGRERDGHLRRPGAFHTTLRWLHGGLLPLVPGDATTRLDLIPTELVTGFVPRLLARAAEPGAIYHLSASREGVPLGELLAFAAGRFARDSAAWRAGQILPPVLASRAAFEDFRVTIHKSRDLLFTQVLESVDSFLPELFYPKRFATRRAERVWGGPLPRPEWRPWLGRVIDRALATNFGRHEPLALSA